jgi:hypothetical protein
MEDNTYFDDFLGRFTIPRLAEEFNVDHDFMLWIMREKPRLVYDEIMKLKLKPDVDM